MRPDRPMAPAVPPSRFASQAGTLLIGLSMVAARGTAARLGQSVFAARVIVRSTKT